MKAFQYAILGWLSVTSGKKDIETFNIEKYKIYEYKAPIGMKPEDLMECFEKKYPNLSPIIDSYDLPGKSPYIAEDMGEWFLHKQIQNSKYVSKKEEADIFFVNTMPILSNYLGECNLRNGSYRQQKWIDIIKRSKLFQSRPEDHYFICQSWTCFNAVSGELADLARQMTYLIHESNRFWISGKGMTSPNDLIVVPYVAHSDVYPLNKKAWKDRTYKVSFVGTLDRRTSVRTILKRPSVLEKPFLYVHDTSIIYEPSTFDDYVKYMTDSQYCLVLEGDTPSSRRLFDAIMSGCIPILIGIKYTMPFEKLIPYESFSIRIDVNEWLYNPEYQLDNINNISFERSLEMYNEMLKYTKYINWRHGSGVLEGILNDIEFKRNNLTEPVQWYDTHLV